MAQRYRCLLLTLCLLAASWAVRAQDAGPVLSGRVITEADEPLAGATVLVRGTFLGSATNSAGEFLIPGAGRVYPLTLNVTYQGYEPQQISVPEPNQPIVVTLIPSRAETQVVVAASRQEENILRAPVTVEKVTQGQIRQLTQPDLLNGLSRFKGIDVNASSMLTNSISTRGFNSAFSERVIQLVDYMDIQAPSLSSGAGNSLGLPDVDVASVEVLYGPSSALYGANAFNGVVLLNSRDAFTDQGLTVRLRGGQRDYFDGQLRYALRLGRRWAFKLTGSYLTARDWLADNYQAQQITQLVPVNNPAGSNLGYDAVNRYGDLGFTYGPTGGALAGRTVFAPGWTERELIAGDDRATLYRILPTLSYLLTDKVKATVEFKRSQGTTTFQNTSRFRSKNFAVNQYRVGLEGQNWFVRAYQTQDFANDSYDLGYLGGFMQNAADPRRRNPDGSPGRNPDGSPISYAQTYFETYAVAYNTFLLSTPGATPAQAAAFAQSTADPTQLRAGSPGFNALRRTIAADDTPGQGARISPSSLLNDVSAQYRFGSESVGSLIVGGAYREYRIGSNGRLFSDTDGQRIRNYEFGGYAQLSRALLADRLKLALTGRLDNFKNFESAFSPRASAVYSLGSKQQHNLRASYGRAFRSPTQIDQYANIDLIRAVYRGNVGAGFVGYNPALSAANGGQGPASLAEAELATFQVRVEPLRLEQVRSYEVGYKGQLTEKLRLDLSYYYSQYRDFVVPGVLVGRLDGRQPSLPELLAGAPSRFQDPRLTTRVLVVAGNLDLLVRTQGTLASLTYSATRALNLSGNYSLNALRNPSREVPFYNTPRHKFNLGAAGELGRHLGYNLNYRWAQHHRYESTFAAGRLAAYQSLDGQLRYALPKLRTTVDVGGSNLLNTNNVQVYGGPQIGRLVYAGLSVAVQ